jgi:hypothetical protein
MDYEPKTDQQNGSRNMLGSHYTAVRTAFPDLEIRLRRKRVRHRYMLFLFLSRYSAPSSPVRL